MKKLSQKQSEVIRLMREGWELGHSCKMEGRSWIQKGGIGKGGNFKNVNSNTFQAIYDRKLIVAIERSFPTHKYALTELGKNCEL